MRVARRRAKMLAGAAAVCGITTKCLDAAGVLAAAGESADGGVFAPLAEWGKLVAAAAAVSVAEFAGEAGGASLSHRRSTVLNDI